MEIYKNIFSDKSTTMTEKSGRYKFQANQERKIIKDVVRKLKLKPTDHLLDIGSNVGNITIPLSYQVSRLTVVDDECFKTLIEEKVDRRLAEFNYISGNFLSNKFVEEKFDKILVYSVLHYLADEAELYVFLSKVLGILSNSGLCLLGDIPNESCKNRFVHSNTGKFLNKKFELLKTQQQKDNRMNTSSVGSFKHIQFNDEVCLKMLGYIRERGFSAYIIPQNKHLPMANTREDILIYNNYY